MSGKSEHKKRAVLENMESGEKHGFAILKKLLAYITKFIATWDESPEEGSE